MQAVIWLIGEAIKGRWLINNQVSAQQSVCETFVAIIRFIAWILLITIDYDGFVFVALLFCWLCLRWFCRLFGLIFVMTHFECDVFNVTPWIQNVMENFHTMIRLNAEARERLSIINPFNAFTSLLLFFVSQIWFNNTRKIFISVHLSKSPGLVYYSIPLHLTSNNTWFSLTKNPNFIKTNLWIPQRSPSFFLIWREKWSNLSR